MQLKKKDTVYYARVFPKTNTFEVIDLIIRTVSDTWFVGIEKKDKQAFLFSFEDINNTIFLDRKDALEKVVDAESESPKVSNEIFYEEY